MPQFSQSAGGFVFKNAFQAASLAPHLLKPLWIKDRGQTSALGVSPQVSEVSLVVQPEDFFSVRFSLFPVHPHSLDGRRDSSWASSSSLLFPLSLILLLGPIISSDPLCLSFWCSCCRHLSALASSLANCPCFLFRFSPRGWFAVCPFPFSWHHSHRPARKATSSRSACRPLPGCVDLRALTLPFWLASCATFGLCRSSSLERAVHSCSANERMKRHQPVRFFRYSFRTDWECWPVERHASSEQVCLLGHQFAQRRDKFTHNVAARTCSLRCWSPT